MLARLAVTVGLTPIDLSFLRFAPGALLLAPWWWRHGGRDLAGLGWRRGLTLALLAGPMFSLLFMTGFSLAPLAHGAVIAPACQMLSGLALGALLAGERPRRESLIGAAGVVAGLAFLGADGWRHAETGALTPLGDLMFAVAGAGWGVFGALSRRWQVDPLRVTAVIVVVATVLMAPLFAWQFEAARFARVGAGMLALQVVAQGLGAGLLAVYAYSRAAALLGAGPAAFFGAIVPGAASLFAIPVLGEIPTALQAAGIVAVVAGLLVAFGAPRAVIGAWERLSRRRSG